VFRRIVLKNAYNKRKTYEILIEGVPMFKSLNVSTGRNGISLCSKHICV